MKTMQPSSKTNEFENSNHINKRKKAIATTFKKKNHKDIVDLLNEEDSEIGEYYARFVK